MLIDTVKNNGAIERGDPRADDVHELQAALQAAGYRVGTPGADGGEVEFDGDFGPGTERVVRTFQKQHGLRVDGVVGLNTAQLLIGTPHELLVAQASPIIKHDAFNNETPHDDTASLIAFYGDPRDGLEAWQSSNVTHVPCPWSLTVEGKPWPHPIAFHTKAAAGLRLALSTIWAAAGKDDSSPLLKHVRVFDGSGNFRPVRGSSRLSCHAFWCALDFDAEHLPLGHGVPKQEMPEEIVNAFIAAGAFWGGNYSGRKDPMHFQWAHE